MAQTRQQRQSLHRNRFRDPGIQRPGIAQLSLLETALWPLDSSSIDGPFYTTQYKFSRPDGNRTTANLTIRAPLGLRQNDEFFLWGLLALTLDRPDADHVLLATPCWCLKRLGMPAGGSQYAVFRQAIERLATVSYHNTHFYNPLTQTHERVTFSFLSTFLPPDIDSPRSWRIEWQPFFFEMCRVTGGRLLFDLDLYRRLNPAERRLFLKLKDRFWRSDRVFMDVDDLTINGLGFSASRPLYKRKYDITQCLSTLLDLGIVCLGRGHTGVKDLFFKRGVGRYTVVLYKGPYFQTPAQSCPTVSRSEVKDDPLYEPLSQIGFDERSIHRIFRDHARANIQRALRITEIAMHDSPKGFPGFKVSPAAFCYDLIKHNRMPPDWAYEYEKQQREQQWREQDVGLQADEVALREQYRNARTAALEQFIRGPAKEPIDEARRTFETLYRSRDAANYQQLAADAAVAKIESELFDFPDFSVWTLSRHVTQQ